MNHIPNTPEVLSELVKAYNANRRKPVFTFYRNTKKRLGESWELVPTFARYLIEYMAQAQGKRFAIDPKTKRITIP